jgi:exosortase A-associated hydrolase 1
MMAMLHTPQGEASEIGLLIVNGGPQYRVGPQRQYFRIARAAAAAGFSSFRFDWQGEGDSEGVSVPFTEVGDQIQSAIVAFRTAAPHVRAIVLWGLCEGASAILLNAQGIDNICGAVIINPWIDDEKLKAQSQIKNYYGRRLFSPSTWKRAITGRLQMLSSMKAVGQSLKNSLGRYKSTEISRKMAEGALACPSLLYISSEYDDTRQLFDHMLNKDPVWKNVIHKKGWQQRQIKGADHVFSTPEAHAALEEKCLSYLDQLRQERDRSHPLPSDRP